jgi:hypothetical protein
MLRRNKTAQHSNAILVRHCYLSSESTGVISMQICYRHFFANGIRSVMIGVLASSIASTAAPAADSFERGTGRDITEIYPDEPSIEDLIKAHEEFERIVNGTLATTGSWRSTSGCRGGNRSIFAAER